MKIARRIASPKAKDSVKCYYPRNRAEWSFLRSNISKPTMSLVGQNATWSHRPGMTALTPESEGIDAMPAQAHDTTSRPVISAIAAELFVADIKASCDFFTQKLGFSLVFTYGEPPFYAQVKRDRALLNLKCVDDPVIDPALRDRESLLSADMAVDTHEEIKQLFLEFQAAGITFFQTLRKEPWGAETFIVKDPDGNLLLFAGPAD